MDKNKTGVELIAAERQRQIDVEGWTPQHDDKHRCGELARAGAVYALNVPDYDLIQDRWPWAKEWWKPSDDPIRNLVKAGALIAAEIDRLQRLKPEPLWCAMCGKYTDHQSGACPELKREAV